MNSVFLHKLLGDLHIPKSISQQKFMENLGGRGQTEYVMGNWKMENGAYKVRNNCRLFERGFKVKTNGVFLFGISFFVSAIFPF